MPKTKLGQWSGVLLAVFLVSLITSIICLDVLGFRRGSIEILIPAIFTGIAGIATFVTGTVSLFKFKDRSLLVILATIIGLLTFLVILMELSQLIVSHPSFQAKSKNSCLKPSPSSVSFTVIFSIFSNLFFASMSKLRYRFIRSLRSPIVLNAF